MYLVNGIRCSMCLERKDASLFSKHNLFPYTAYCSSCVSVRDHLKSAVKLRGDAMNKEWFKKCGNKHDLKTVISNEMKEYFEKEY